jgi:hypothetical protein
MALLSKSLPTDRKRGFFVFKSIFFYLSKKYLNITFERYNITCLRHFVKSFYSKMTFFELIFILFPRIIII